MELSILCAGAGEKNWHGAKAERPLRNKGKRQAQKIGAWLGQQGQRPQIVLTAGCLRSRATAAKALKAGGWSARNIRTSSELEKGNLPDLPNGKRALLVAPPASVRALEALLALEAAPGAGVLLRLTCENRQLRLKDRIDPKLLPDWFPFPAPDGPERRDRPAYYYRQSAVIPFRRLSSGTQILIVGSSSGRHWTLPKGIVEPGLAPAASAKVEAREEAGVEGRVRRSALGRFSYEKWGATCDVDVYAMAVTCVLQGAEWEERHRKRKWVTQDEAAAMLKQPSFSALVKQI